MEVSLLREYITLSQTLNYTKAAEALHLSQPTLSKHIVSLEKELGCSLFERDRRRVKLTEAGVIFAAAAMQVVDALDEAQCKINSIKTSVPIKVSGIITDNVVASVTSIATALLDGEGHPPIVYGTSTDEESFIEQVMKDEIDIALAFIDIDKANSLGLSCMPIARSQFVALVNLSNPLARCDGVSIDDLRSYRFVKFVDSYAINGWINIENVCRNHGFVPRTRVVLGRNRSNYCTVPIDADDVLIVQSSLPQLCYLGDFSRIAIIPVTDEDAAFRIYAIYKTENQESLKPILDAYAQARRIVVNHGSGDMLVESD